MAIKKERRIAILKDAIKQIRLNNIIPAHEGVINHRTSKLQFDDNKQAKLILKELFKSKNKKVCKVCARGALLVSTFHKENDFVLGEFEKCETYNSAFDENSTTDVRLLKLFSKTQLTLMENAFEVCEYLQDKKYDCIVKENGKIDYCTYSINCSKLTFSQYTKSFKFGIRYKDPDKRLLGIFRNAVKNLGIFKP